MSIGKNNKLLQIFYKTRLICLIQYTYKKYFERTMVQYLLFKSEGLVKLSQHLSPLQKLIFPDYVCYNARNFAESIVSE